MKESYCRGKEEKMAYVLITGATSGIGYALARIFHEKGHSLILVGRNEKKLLETKNSLCGDKGNEGTDVLCVCQDLSDIGAAKKVYESVKAKGLEVELLVNNAGAGYVGEFADQEMEQISEHIQLNITSLTLLTRLFAEDMKLARRGKILNVASTGAYHPGAYTAVYYAAKAYVLSLSEALERELRPYGITVYSLCPGATQTNFAKAAGRSDSKMAMSSEFVALETYKGLMKQRKIIIPGLKNRIWVKLPKWIAKPLIEHYQKKLSKKE